MLNEGDTLLQKEGLNLRNYLLVLLRRIWVIITCFVVIVTIVTIKSYKDTPIYRTSVQLLIESENPNVISFDEVVQTNPYVDRAYIQTQLKILQSRTVARRVIRSLKLEDSPEFNPTKKSNTTSLSSSSSSHLKKKESEKKPLETDKIDENSKNKPLMTDEIPTRSGFVTGYISRLKVEPIRNSRLVNFSFEGTHPDIIKEIANRHAQEFIKNNMEMKYASTHGAIDWLQKQLEEKKKRVEKAENALQVYKEKKKIVTLLKDRQNITTQRLKELNTAYINARTERIGQETLYNQTKKFADNPILTLSMPSVMKNSLLQDLRKEYVLLSTEVKNMSDKYGEKHPDMIRHVAEMKEMESSITAEVSKIIESVKTDYIVALAKEKILSQDMKDQTEIALNLNRDAIAYDTLQREAESEREMYVKLLKRMKETGITGDLGVSNIRIVDPAETPRYPIKPNKKKNIIFAVLMGMALGVGLAFFLEYLDNTVKSADDVEKYLRTTLLGVLEKVKIPKNQKQVSLEIIAHLMPKSTFAESMRNVRTSIMLSSTDNPKKSLLVTSTHPGEGKTFVASNLAIIIAKTGKKTLLVDADFRKPRVHKVFNIETLPGLSNYFIGESDLESTIKPTTIPNLSIVTCGLIPPNPSEMLGSHSMEAFCSNVLERFDTVIFDTPPALTVTDAIVLSNIVNGIIYVIKSGEVTKEMARRAVMQLQGGKSELLGVVMNNVDVSKGSYYHYYSHYYQYGYGNDSEEDSSKNKKG